MYRTVLATSSAAVALESARRRTSSATTAKPRPCSPARAASMAAFRASRLVCDEICLIRSMNAVIGSENRASSWTWSGRRADHLAHVEQRLPGRGHVGPVARGELLDPVAQLGHAGRRLGVGLGDLAQAHQQGVGLLHPAHLLLGAGGDLDHRGGDLAAARRQLLAHGGEVARAVADLAGLADHRHARRRGAGRPCRPSRGRAARSRSASRRRAGSAGGRRRRTARRRR